MKNTLYIFLLFAILSPAVIFAQAVSSKAQQLTTDITYLASKELAGRKSGTEGDSLAADYIRRKFTENGARLLGNNGFQYFGIIADVTAGKNNTFILAGLAFEAGKDFMPFSFSTSDTIESDVVFVGFGITGTSGDLTWDDYAGLDIKGKWVLALRGDPEPDNAESAFIPMSTDRAKALAARDRGAAGLLLVSPSSVERKDKTIDIAFDKTVSDAGLPVISITRALASEVLGLPSASVDSLEKAMISSRTPVKVAGLKEVKASTDVMRRRVTTRNIMAMIPGGDPSLKDEIIVVGAHYDHLGMGGDGSGSRMPDMHEVHGGADDNASGVASLIAMAQHFSVDANRPGRSILFVAFGAEEMGILGSRYFVANCPVDLKSVKAMVNLDMVGRLNIENPVVTISGTGTFTKADSLLDLLAISRPFSVKKSPDGYGPSDHAAFYSEGIPVLFLSTGVHEDYHTPDDLASRINYTGQVSVTDFTTDLVSALTSMTPPPVFREAGGRKEAGRYGRNLKVVLGIIPDVSGAETAGGMKVEGTRADGPAAKAGMLKGDVITAINGLPVGNIYEYMSRLGKLNPGEIANVEVLREGKKVVLIIQL